MREGVLAEVAVVADQGLTGGHALLTVAGEELHRPGTQDGDHRDERNGGDDGETGEEAGDHVHGDDCLSTGVVLDLHTTLHL